MNKKPTKERIVDTALMLFETYGYHGVSVDQIVEESHTSKGGFYHNFRSKEELLYTIHDLFITYVVEKAEDIYTKSETPTEKLYKMIISFVLMFEKYKPHISLFYQESLYLSAHYFECIKRKHSRYKEMMDQVVNEGIENKEFRKELPVPITSMAIFGIINWTYTWYKEKGTYSLQDIASIFADFILSAVLTKDALENPKYSSFFIKPILL